MIQAILYTSGTGTTAQYAKMLGEKTGLPVCPLQSASSVPLGADIIYMGWVMASGVRGYKQAAKRYHVRAVCGVCMGETGSQIPEVRKQNTIADDIPVFTMRGGFDMNKLHGIYKVMMSVMKKTAGKKLAQKTDRTPDEDVMLNMLLHGGNYVAESNLQAVLDWYGAHKG